MGLQVPHVFILRGRRKVLYGQLSAHLARGIAGIGVGQRVLDKRRALDVRPCPYDDCDTAEIFGIERGQVLLGRDVPFTWRGCIRRAIETWRDKVSGPGGALSRQ